MEDKEIKSEIDVTTKFCMASNFVSHGFDGLVCANMEEGDTKESAVSQALDCELVYIYLSKMLTDKEIQAIAEVLNNLPDDLEEEFFHTVYGTNE